MVSTDPSDHADATDDSVEHSSSAVSPYNTEELNELVKVNVPCILRTQLTTYSTETANRECGISEPSPKVHVWYDPKRKQ